MGSCYNIRIVYLILRKLYGLVPYEDYDEHFLRGVAT